MAAAEKGRTDVVVLLLARNADCNPEKQEGQAALDLACKHRYKDVVKLLRAHGAPETGKCPVQ